MVHIRDGGLVSITFSDENSEVNVSGKVCGISELKSMDTYATIIICSIHLGTHHYDGCFFLAIAVANLLFISAVIEPETLCLYCIEVFTSYPELNAIVRKVSHIIGEAPRLNSIIASQGLYRFSERFFTEHPEAISLSGSGTGNKIVSSIIEKLPDVFIIETDVDEKQYVRFLGRMGVGEVRQARIGL